MSTAVSAAALSGPAAVRSGMDSFSAHRPCAVPSAASLRRGHGFAGPQPAVRSRAPFAVRAAPSGDAEERAFPIGSFEEADIRANISEAGKRLRRTLAEAGAAVAESALVGWPWSAEDAEEDAELAAEEAKWAAWEKTFEAVDEDEAILAALGAQLENAVINENYDDAMQVKAAIDAVASKDAVGNVLREMDSALEEERYAEAARLRDEGGVGLLGWWAGRGETKEGQAADPFGHVVKVTGRHGRYVGQAYTARDLADLQELRDDAGVPGGLPVPDLPSGGSQGGVGLGIPVMELFLKQDEEGRYVQQACAFRGDPMELAGGGPATMGEEAAGGQGGDGGWDMDVMGSGGKMHRTVGGMGAVGRGGGKRSDTAPVPAPFTPEDMDGDEIPDMPYETVGMGGGNLMQLQRVPAELRTLGRSEFVLDLQDGVLPAPPSTPESPPIIEGPGLGSPPSATGEGEGGDDDATPKGLGKGSGLPIRRGPQDSVNPEDGASSAAGEDDGVESAEEKWQRVAQEVARLEAGSVTSKRRLAQALKDAAEHMLEGGVPPDPLADALTREVEPLYTTLRQTRTRFTKLNVSAPASDPFAGLYLGVFGPHGPEVLQLCRGRWGGDPLPDGADPEECVEASKVTGDANVPVGVASFRAQVGPRHRLDHRGVYPEELCVVGRYVGEGRVAQAGFKDARWVEGELLQFGSSGAALTGGAELGFVWAVPGERRFLLLFKRLDLTKV